MTKEERLEEIKKEFNKSQNLLNILADKNKQEILIVLLANCVSGGINVKEISEKINLSRPAVSHHLKELLENGIVSLENIGTNNFYHLKGTKELLSLKSLIKNVELYIEERQKEI